MYAFSYWHAYYDSLFLKPSPQPSHYLLEQLQITMALHMNWPVCSDLPHLSRLFQSFQKHLMSSSNWCPCFCEEWELRVMEERINDVVILLYCEKIYGREYWEMDQRRIQASFTHFCIIFRHYLLAILPEDAESVQQAHSQGRLPTSLENLQAIVNVILEHLKPIHRYLFSSRFQEENQLTLELFTELSRFIQRLPKLQREEIMEVPRLMRYICLSNTLQVNNCHSIKEFKFTRKKSETFQQKIEVQSPLKDAPDYDRKSDILVNRQFIKQSSISSRGGSRSSKEKRKVKHEKYSFFRFNKNLSKVDNRAKKNHTLTISTKGKSSTIDRSQRFRSTTMEKSFAGILKSRTFEKKSSKNKHRKSEAKSNESTAFKAVEGRHLDLGQQEEMERPVKIKANKKITVNLQLKNVGEILNLSTGKPKGWAAIREHIFTRIASRKLKKILNN